MRRSRSAAGSDEDALVLLVDPDPYLAYLLSCELPRARFIESVDDWRYMDRTPDLAIVDIRSPRAAEVLSERRASKVLGVCDAGRAVPPGADGVLVRPFDPAEVGRAVRAAVGLRSAPESTVVHRVLSLLAGARVLATVVAVVLELAEPDPARLRAFMAAASFAFAGLTLVPRRRMSSVTAWLDVAFGATVVAATGGIASNYMGVALVVCVNAGVVLGIRGGLASGALVPLMSAPTIVSVLVRGSIGTQTVVAWAALFTLGGVGGGLAVRLWRADSGSKSALVAEANHVLAELYRIARAIPGGFDLRAATSHVLDELRDGLASPAGALLLMESSLATCAGSYGLRDECLPAGDACEVRSALGESTCVISLSSLPEWLQCACASFDCWIVTPVGRRGARIGYLLAACPGHRRHGEARAILRQLGTQTGVAIENTRLFAGVRAMSVDEERRRLARELHDGVAQTLAHVRLELEFLSRFPVPKQDSAREAARLARVVARATEDIRGTIDELRSTSSTDGLVEALRSYLRDVGGLGGPRMVLEARGTPHLSRTGQAEVFRIVQEAVSNAVRHASASRVLVAVEADPNELQIAVRDDGIGIKRGRNAGRRGLGLETMRERAERIGGHLDIGREAPHGTVVQLVVGTANADEPGP